MVRSRVSDPAEEMPPAPRAQGGSQQDGSGTPALAVMTESVTTVVPRFSIRPR